MAFLANPTNVYRRRGYYQLAKAKSAMDLRNSANDPQLICSCDEHFRYIGQPCMHREMNGHQAATSSTPSLNHSIVGALQTIEFGHIYPYYKAHSYESSSSGASECPSKYQS